MKSRTTWAARATETHGTFEPRLNRAGFERFERSDAVERLERGEQVPRQMSDPADCFQPSAALREPAPITQCVKVTTIMIARCAAREKSPLPVAYCLMPDACPLS
jgi:hypothetical protein